jgi:hypothetical protein
MAHKIETKPDLRFNDIKSPKKIDWNKGNNGYVIEKNLIFKYNITHLKDLGNDKIDYKFDISDKPIGSLIELPNDAIVITNETNGQKMLEDMKGFIYDEFWYLFMGHIVYIICPGIEKLGTKVLYHKRDIRQVFKCKGKDMNRTPIDCSLKGSTNGTTVKPPLEQSMETSLMPLNMTSILPLNEISDPTPAEESKSWIPFVIIGVIVLVIVITIAFGLFYCFGPKPKSRSQ